MHEQSQSVERDGKIYLVSKHSGLPLEPLFPFEKPFYGNEEEAKGAAALRSWMQGQVEPVEEATLGDASPVSTEPAPVQPGKRPPSWDEIETDARYRKATAKQQSVIRGTYWDQYVARHPRVMKMNADKKKDLRARFINKPLQPPPPSAMSKFVDAEAGVAEAAANIASEAIGGTLAAGMAGVGTLVNAALKGRPDLIPSTYETIRDSLRDFLVFQPQTQKGKEYAEKAGGTLAYPFVKADEFLAKAQNSLYETLEPKIGGEEAARISVALTAGLRGTAIYAMTALGGKKAVERKKGEASPEPPLETVTPEVVPPEGPRPLAGPEPRAMLEGPDIFRMPDEMVRRRGEPGTIQRPGPPRRQEIEGPRGGPEPRAQIGPDELTQLMGDVEAPPYGAVPRAPVRPPAAQAVPERALTPLEEIPIEQLRQMLTTDDMTGLPNRIAYQYAPKKAVQAFADMDGLKYMNDNFGHGAGDAVIQAYAQAFKEAGVDAYRAGRGDEMMVQFDAEGIAYQKMNQIRRQLENAVIEYTTPDGEVKRFKGLTFSYGVGRTLFDADIALNKSKERRTAEGFRTAERGGRPPSFEEVAGQPTERRRVQGEAAIPPELETALAQEMSGATPQTLSPGVGLPEPYTSSPAGGGVAPIDRMLADKPPENSIVPKSQSDRLADHISAERRKQEGYGETKPSVVETGPGFERRPGIQAEGPVHRLSVEELEKLAKQVMETPLSPEEQANGGVIHLYSGLPLNQALGVFRWARQKVSTKARVGQDLSSLQLGLKSILSPTFLAKAHPLAEQVVTFNQLLRHRDYYAKAEQGALDYRTRTRGLSDKEKFTVGQLLDTYFDSRDIPVEVLNRRRDITPQVIMALDGIRHQILEPARRNRAPGDRQHIPLAEYFKELSERGSAGLRPDLREQMIRGFAEENGLDFATAQQLLQGRIPNMALFGRLGNVPGAPRAGALSLDKVMEYFVPAVARKGYLDQFLPMANEALKQIEQPRIKQMLRDYIDRQRGLPVSQFQTLLRQHPHFSKFARFEALRQYISKLGIRPVLTFLNSLQYPMFDGAKALHRALVEEKGVGPIADFARGAYGVLTKRGRKIVADSGVMTGPGAWAPDVKGPIKMLDQIAKVTGFFHNAVDKYSRAASYLRNYYEAERALRGLPEGVASPADAELFKQMAGYKGVAETQFFYEVSGSPSAFGNPIAANMLRFRQYMLQSVGTIANMSGSELVVFLGVMDMLGGPDAIPGLRQLFAELRRSHPDAPITKILAGLQSASLAGVTGVDVGYALGLGFIPGSSADADLMQKWQDDFGKTLVEEVVGPTVRDIKNLARDIRTGVIDLDHPDWRELLGSRGIGSSISVTMQQGIRALKEWENKYIEYSRGRPGPPLSDRDIILRGIGFTSQDVARRSQEYAQWRVDIKEAIDKKIEIEDKYVRWRKRLINAGGWSDELRSELEEVTNEQHDFNRRYRGTVGLRVTPRSLRDAYRATRLPLDRRVARSRAQRKLLMERLDPYRPKDRSDVAPLPGEQSAQLRFDLSLLDPHQPRPAGLGDSLSDLVLDRPTPES